MKRRTALALVWTLPSVVMLAIVYGVFAWFRIPPPTRLPLEARAAVIATLRAALEGTAAAAPEHPGLRRGLDHRGPVAASIYLDGTLVTRVDGFGATVADAARAAAELLGKDEAVAKLDANARARARIKVDVVDGRGPIVRDHPLLALVALDPGVDGLGVTIGDGLADGSEQLLMPDELILAGLLTKDRPVKMVPELAIGLHFTRADNELARRSRLPGKGYQAQDRHYWRFRSDAFVEGPPEDRAPRPLDRGIPPGPPVSAEALRAAAIAGGHFLVEHLGANGRYVYETNLTTGKGTDPTKPGAYSIPRHAGTTYFLAQLYRLTNEEFLREPIERAFAHLQELIDAGGCSGTTPDGIEFECVVDRGETRASLGSTALTVVALAEYQLATHDPRYQPLLERLAAWILYMQRPDGSFRHIYDLRTKLPSEKEQLLYYSGEAALAMARMYVVTQDPKYSTATEHALDWLVGWYDFFLGAFIYGEEHWTCIASEAIWPAVKKQSYVDFCRGYGAFLREQQAEPGDYPDHADLVGSYGMTPFVMPFNTPAGSRSEAMISSFLLTRYHGEPDEDLRRQVLSTMGYLLRQQVRRDSDFAIPLEAKALGGVPSSPIDRNVRIDFVQHVCSAMIRSIELLGPEPAR